MEFSVNGAAMGTDVTAPYELLFTVPAGVSNVAFGAAGTTASASQVTARSTRGAGAARSFHHRHGTSRRRCR